MSNVCRNQDKLAQKKSMILRQKLLMIPKVIEKH